MKSFNFVAKKTKILLTMRENIFRINDFDLMRMPENIGFKA